MEGWHDFFAMIGTASASLVGLIFVAMSITANSGSEARTEARQVYALPTIVHLSLTLLLALTVLSPAAPRVAGALQLAFELAATVFAVSVAYRIFAFPEADLEDRILYGLGPPLAYAIVIAGSVLTLRGTAAGPLRARAWGDRAPFDLDPERMGPHGMGGHRSAAELRRPHGRRGAEGATFRSADWRVAHPLERAFHRVSTSFRSYSHKSAGFALTRVARGCIIAAVTLTPRHLGAVSDPAQAGPGVSVRSLKTEQYSSA